MVTPPAKAPARDDVLQQPGAVVDARQAVVRLVGAVQQHEGDQDATWVRTMDDMAQRMPSSSSRPVYGNPVRQPQEDEEPDERRDDVEQQEQAARADPGPGKVRPRDGRVRAVVPREGLGAARPEGGFGGGGPGRRAVADDGGLGVHVAAIVSMVATASVPRTTRSCPRRVRSCRPSARQVDRAAVSGGRWSITAAPLEPLSPMLPANVSRTKRRPFCVGSVTLPHPGSEVSSRRLPFGQTICSEKLRTTVAC